MSIQELVKHSRPPCIRSISFHQPWFHQSVTLSGCLPGRGGRMFLLAEIWNDALDVGLSRDRPCGGGCVIDREPHLAGVATDFEHSH